MRILISFVLMISLTVTANLLLKSGATMPRIGAGEWLGLINWKVAAGLATFALSAVFYLSILTKLPLNVAQSFAAFQFVAVILAAWLILGEPISLVRGAGIMLICAGIFLVGLSV